MAIKKALVQSNGKVKQIASTDNLESTIISTQMINGTASTIVKFKSVYVDSTGSVNSFDQATGFSASADVVGMVVDTSIASGATGNIALSGILEGTTGEWDAVTGQTGGLTKGSTYFLGVGTAGNITVTPPSVSGDVVVSMGTALTTTKFKLNIQSGIAL